MKYRQLKYSSSALMIATIYWFFDSSIHYFIFKEPGFEFIPSEFNELWMRSMIFILVTCFGIYVDISVKHMKKLYDEKYNLQLKLDQNLTKLLGEFVSICCVCKKVKTKTEHIDKESNWEAIDAYMSKKTDIKFSHGYCPECEAKAEQEVAEFKKKTANE